MSRLLVLWAVGWIGVSSPCAFAAPNAQDAAAATEPLATFDETTSVSWVLVPVTVEPVHIGRGDAGRNRTSKDNPVGLSREDFQLTVDNRPVPFEDFISPFENPQTLLFFQDLSGSMANSGKLTASRDIVRWFVEHSRSGDAMAVTTFASGSILVEVPITEEIAVIEESVDLWQAYGTTALHDAVTWIPQVRLTARTAPAVILITDGLDNASSFTPEQARAMAKTAEVPVFVIALQPATRRAPLGERADRWRYSDVLRRLAEVTGGEYVEARAGEIEAACSTIHQALRNRYSLGFRLAGGGEEGYHSIRVTTPKKRFNLRFRAGYSGAAPQRLSTDP